MKKTIIATLSSITMVSGAFGQGQVAWASNPGNGLVSASTDKITSVAVPVGNPTSISFGAVNFGQLNIDFFVAPVGTALTIGPDGNPNFTAAWTELGQTIHQVKQGAGRTSSVLNMPGAFAAGSDVQLEVVGWTGTATSWSAALASLSPTTLIGYSGETFNGTQLGALGWDQPTANPATTPPGTPASLTTGVSGFQGLVLEPVPEPTTIALGGLGAAALLMFRRRK